MRGLGLKTPNYIRRRKINYGPKIKLWAIRVLFSYSYIYIEREFASSFMPRKKAEK